MRRYPFPTRREFLKTSTLGALGLSAYPNIQMLGAQNANVAPAALPFTRPDDAKMRELVARALDAAMQAGARYADVRLTYTQQAGYAGSSWNRTEVLGVGVRAMLDGFWGFASSSVWKPDEVARLGRDAVELARASMLGSRQSAELASVSVVVNGRWSSPIERDFFDISVDEIRDFLEGLSGLSQLFLKSGMMMSQRFSAHRQVRTFASSEGSYITQTSYRTQGAQAIGPVLVGPGLRQGGWDLVSSYPWREEIVRGFERNAESERFPVKSVDVGRFDVVFAPDAVASLMSETLGRAAQLDRALGYEANASGSSYLGPDPMALLGTPIVAPILTVTGERSTAQALATTAWDDEGVVPTSFTMIKNGVLTDYQTNRDQAARLAPWYRRQNMPFHSHGCAGAPDAEAMTMQHVPNLILEPGASSASLDDLARAMGKGLIISNVDAGTDFQCLNGGGRAGGVYEVRGGQRVARINGAGILFNARELWKNVTALGGPASAAWTHLSPAWVGGVESVKGEPEQKMLYSISAVPALINNVTVVDVMRKG